MAATKESPGLVETTARYAAIGLLAVGAITLANIILPTVVIASLLKGALVGGAVGAIGWTVGMLASFAKGPKAA